LGFLGILRILISHGGLVMGIISLGEKLGFGGINGKQVIAI
jgi:hypothetical protein